MTRTRRIVIFAIVLAVASAVIGVTLLASRPASSDMPGMDMSVTQMPKNTPTPAAKAGDMPGMDMPASSKTTELASNRPLAPVLGTFGGGTAVVLLAAGMMRRKDRAASQAKEAARAARRAQK